MPLPRSTIKYLGYGPLTLARMTHQFEDEDNDVEFLAVQDAVEALPAVEQRIYREQYIRLHKRT